MRRKYITREQKAEALLLHHSGNGFTPAQIAKLVKAKPEAVRNAIEADREREMDRLAAREARRSAFADEASPVTVAVKMLNGRFDARRWTLDGLPTHLDIVMPEANRALLAAGMPQIAANPRWIV